jgi:protein-tyrosine phosphatase
VSLSKQVLFLCTGNYYRSRFAEILFNHLAQARQLEWRADSRGLAREFGEWNVGPMSPFTTKAIAARGIECPSSLRVAMHCHEDDLQGANMIVALKEAEHRSLLAQHFAGWEDRVEYWHVHDLDGATPDEALGEIEVLVKKLIERIA